jgi:hypothetical protein
MTPPPAESGDTSGMEAPNAAPQRQAEPWRGAEPANGPATPPSTKAESSPEPRSGDAAPGQPAPSKRSIPDSLADPQPAPASLLLQLKGWLDLALMADVFLVMAAALWFALAVLSHSRGIEAPLHLFQQLWEPLFTPAIGLLMAAALLSGALGWWQRRGQR